MSYKAIALVLLTVQVFGSPLPKPPVPNSPPATPVSLDGINPIKSSSAQPVAPVPHQPNNDKHHQHPQVLPPPADNDDVDEESDGVEITIFGGDFPFGGGLGSLFGGPQGGPQGGRKPFGQNPFGQNPFGQNPFASPPFSPFGSFGQNNDIHDFIRSILGGFPFLPPPPHLFPGNQLPSPAVPRPGQWPRPSQVGGNAGPVGAGSTISIGSPAIPQLPASVPAIGALPSSSSTTVSVGVPAVPVPSVPALSNAVPSLPISIPNLPVAPLSPVVSTAPVSPVPITPVDTTGAIQAIVPAPPA